LKIFSAGSPWNRYFGAVIASALTLALAGYLNSAFRSLMLAALNPIDTLPQQLGLAAVVLTLPLALSRYGEHLQRRKRERYGSHEEDLDREYFRTGAIDMEAALTRMTEIFAISTGTDITASLRRPSFATARGKWEVLLGPDLKPRERTASEVPIHESWLDSAQGKEPGERLFQIDNLLPASRSHGPDLDALRRFDYETVVCVRIAPAGPGDRLPTPCLVVAAKKAGVFKEQERSYLRSVAGLLERHFEDPPPRDASTASRTVE
jgi:hypothetical protein